MNITEAKSIIDTNYTGLLAPNNITLNTEKAVPYLEIKGFSDIHGIKHAFSTRLGGVSTGFYESLNLGYKTDDSPENVTKNIELLSESLGINPDRISFAQQVHGTKICVITEDDVSSADRNDRVRLGYDAQITNTKNIPLFVYGADCVPILFADPISRVIGSAHAGWKGTTGAIAAKTIKKMQEEYGCLTENIHAVIGPSIGPDNYEVDETVIKQVINCPYIDTSEENVLLEPVGNDDFKYIVYSGSYLRDGIPDDYLGKTQPNRGAAYELFRSVKIRNRYMLNLWNLNELIMINAGLKPGNIYNTKLCTMKYHDLFFSHRYSNGRRGLHAGVIMLV